jgi:hypothetical protein
MSAADEILADIPMDQLAAQLGVDEATAEQASGTSSVPIKIKSYRPSTATSVVKRAS